MEVRLTNLRIFYERPNTNIAHYFMIKHPDRFKNPRRGNLLKQAKKRYQNDGISNVNYTLTKVVQRGLFTHYYINVGDPPQYIIDLLNPVTTTTTISPAIPELKNNMLVNLLNDDDNNNENKENEIKYDFIHLD